MNINDLTLSYLRRQPDGLITIYDRDTLDEDYPIGTVFVPITAKREKSYKITLDELLNRVLPGFEGPELLMATNTVGVYLSLNSYKLSTFSIIKDETFLIGKNFPSESFHCAILGESLHEFMINVFKTTYELQRHDEKVQLIEATEKVRVLKHAPFLKKMYTS